MIPSGSPSEYERAAMDQVGDYVRRALPLALQRNGVDWPTHVEWDGDHVLGSISRGGLVLSRRHAAERWWEPVEKRTGDGITVKLGRVLWGYWKLYRNADEEGRLHVPLWRRADGDLFGDPREGAEVVTAALAPGVRLGHDGAGVVQVHRLGEPAGVTLRTALERGWVEPGR